MTKSLNNKTPFLIGLITSLAIVFFIELLVLKKTNGVLIYPIDDTFIHLQIANNLVKYHSWGIIPNEFASASSSILYTVLLAIFIKMFSSISLIPLLINILSLAILLFQVNNWLFKYKLNNTKRTIIIIFLIALTPLPILVISGMEHTLQCLFTFLFLTTLIDHINTDTVYNTKKNILPITKLLILGPLVTLIRYEGIFLIFVTCLFLLLRKQWKNSFLIGFVSILPLIIFGIISIFHGNYFFPNSLLIKSIKIPLSFSGIFEFISNTLIYKLTIVNPLIKPIGSPPPGISLLSTQRLLIIIPLLLIFVQYKMPSRKDIKTSLFIILLTTIIHLIFAGTGWFYRYEAYLIFCSSFLICFTLLSQPIRYKSKSSLFSKSVIFIAIFYLIFPFILRSSAAFSKCVQACVNIFEQQYQVSNFLKSELPGISVGLNDIGIISFYSGAKVYDLWGLGNTKITKAKLENKFDSNYLNNFVNSNRLRLTIIYEEWFKNEIPSTWIKIATWKINNNVICGGDTITFYSTSYIDIEVLRNKIKLYVPHLPKNIEIKYF